MAHRGRSFPLLRALPLVALLLPLAALPSARAGDEPETDALVYRFFQVGALTAGQASFFRRRTSRSGSP